MRNITNQFRNNKIEPFKLIDEAFPELNSPILVKETTMNFKEKMKKEESPKNYTLNNIVEPGFIRWKYNNKLQTWTREDGCMKEMEDNMNKHNINMRQKKQKALIKRWQEYRDIQNELLTDRSPFWNTSCILSIITEENTEKTE